VAGGAWAAGAPGLRVPAAGVCNLFLVCEPLRGWRQVTVTARRTRIDWAYCIKELVDVCYPTLSGSCWCKTTDNLNTHTPASL
jgi:hypothetical protein